LCYLILCFFYKKDTLNLKSFNSENRTGKEILTLTSPSGEVIVDEYSSSGMDLLLNELGEWSVTLTVIDSSEVGVVSEPVSILVANRLPIIANIQFNQPNLEESNYVVTFEASDTDGEITSINYFLTSPSGVESTIDTATSGMIINLEENGVWQINISAQDNEGGSTELTKSINTGVNSTFVANLVIESGAEDKTKVFNASGPINTNGTITQYKFTLSKNGGEAFDIITEQDKTTYTFPSEGKWRISLAVIDDIGENSINEAVKTILIDTLPPDTGEDGKLTLAGIDSDNDGVRDDVERYITSLSLSETKKIVLKEYGKIIQQVILNSSYKDESINISYEKLSYDYCIKSRMSKDEYENYTKEIEYKFYNTESRVYAWAEQQVNFRGQMVMIETDETIYGEYCDEL
jgi:hypothetical protein